MITEEQSNEIISEFNLDGENNGNKKFGDIIPHQLKSEIEQVIESKKERELGKSLFKKYQLRNRLNY